MTKQKEREQGLSLLDIGPVCENVPLGSEGKSVKVTGISAKGIFSVFQRFPEVMQWFKGGGIDVKGLAGQMPDAIAAIIAAGTGAPGDSGAEAVAESLPIESQLDILEAIGRLSFKNGFGPFVQRILELSNAAKSVNYGRVPDMKSPQELKPASPPDTTAKPSGP